jgi:GR25 family glycosyltransferase involved in LPS biosynthesis
MKSVFASLCMQIASALASPANRSFDIVYLNLERHEGKKLHIERMLKYANCSFTRFNAVDGQGLCSNNKSIMEYTNGIGIAPTDDSIRQRIDARNAGRAGCHLSHLIVLRGIDASGKDRPVLILEDDVDLDVSFAEKVEDVIASPPEKWDIILLGGMFKKRWWAHSRNKRLVDGRYQACLHAYLVNGAKSARRLADAIDTTRCPGRPVDVIIERTFRNDQSFAFYCFSPMIAVQRRDLFESDITIPSSAPFYRKLAMNLFSSEFLRPLKDSLSKASSGVKNGAELASGRLTLLFILLLFSFCMVAG